MIDSKVPQWDLSELYKSIDDPQIIIDKKLINSNIKLLAKKFNANNLEESIKSYEKILQKISLLDNYAYLIYSTDSIDVKISKFYQEISEYISKCSEDLLWFDIYLIKSKKNVKKYQHYLDKQRIFEPYCLDEKTEKILKQKDQTGAEAFIRLYDQIDSSKDFNGKTYSEIVSVFSNDKNRTKREKAGKIISEKLEENSNNYRFILNTLLLDKKISDEIRGYKYPQQSTFLSYGIDKKIVETMTKVITKNYKISERYYLAKSKLLKQELFEWDRYSDIYPNSKSKLSWDDAKKIVLDSFKEFSDVFYKEANLFFENNWIDAKVRKGKRNGGYCSYVSNKLHPYIFMNFTGETEEVQTLAHELGHAIHGILSKDNNYLEYRPSTATAEIASVFSESLIFDKLYKETKNKKEKINLLGKRLQGSFATVFRQTAFYLFESELHEHRRNHGELSNDEINNLYQKYLQPMFGKGLTLTENHKKMWMVISHFYHYNFYVFTYSFGQLLAISLYSEYKKNKKTFTEKYIKALSLGGSKTPFEIVKSMGIDISKENFWQSGLDLINKEVTEFEKLII